MHGYGVTPGELTAKSQDAEQSRKQTAFAILDAAHMFVHRKLWKETQEIARMSARPRELRVGRSPFFLNWFPLAL